MAGFELRKNPTTGETFLWEEGSSEWRSVQAARNPQTGEVHVLDSGATAWRSLGVRQGQAPAPAPSAPAPAAPASPASAPTLGFGAAVAPAAEALAQRPPVAEPDPFEGEGLVGLMGRRGQQVAAGVTDSIATAPEALAVAAAAGQARRVGEAGQVLDQRASMIGEMEARLQDSALDPEARAQIVRTLTDLRQGQGVIGGMADEPLVAAQDRPLFARGDQLRGAVEGVVGAPDPRDDSFGGQLAYGVGNVAGMAASAGLAGLMTGPAGALAVGGAQGAAMNASGNYREARAAGATEEDARGAAGWGGLIGATEIVPLGRALRLLPPRLRGAVTSRVGGRLADIAQASGEEAAQEAASQVLNNLVARGYFDPERGWAEGVTEAALLGATLGGGVGAAVAVAEGQAATPPAPGRQAPESGVAAPAVQATSRQGTAGVPEGVPDGAVSANLLYPLAEPSAEAIVSPAPAKNQDVPPLADRQGVGEESPPLEGAPVASEVGVVAGQPLQAAPAVGAASAPAAGPLDTEPVGSAVVPPLQEEGAGGAAIRSSAEAPPVQDPDASASPGAAPAPASAVNGSSEPGVPIPEEGVQPTADVALRPVRRDVAVTPAGREVEVEVALVEASDLVPSNLDDGRVNPAYPQERQPRDRTRDASEMQVGAIAQKLDPRLLGPTPSTADGAPLIDAAGVVESGNGRTLAIRRAYAEVPASARRYREGLAAQGYDVEGMRQPVLVRVRRTPMGPEDIAAYTRESNERTTAALSSTERAMADARALPEAALGLYRGGDVDAAANRDFVRAFMGSVVGEADRGPMIDKSGRMSQEAVRRVQSALLAKAYGDADLVAKLTESADTSLKAIGGALLDVAPRWAQMRAQGKAGTIAPEMDQTAALLEAVGVVDRARAAGRNVAEFTNQPDLLTGEGLSPVGRDFLGLMFRDTEQWTRPVGRDTLVRELGRYVEEALKTSPGPDMFGATADPAQVLGAARGGRDDRAGGNQADLLAQAPRGDGADLRGAGQAGAGAGVQAPGDAVGRTSPEGGRRAAVRDQAQPAEGPFGPIFNGFTNDPEAAIAKLIDEKRGEVPDAFVHPSLGPIAFVYGDESQGLSHIRAKHGPTALATLPSVLRTGEVENLGTRLRFTAPDGDSIAIVPTDHKGTPKKWVLTSYSREEVQASREEGARQGRTIDETTATAPSTPEATGRVEGSARRQADQGADPEATGRLRAGLPKLRRELDRLGLSDVGLAIAERLEVQGRFEAESDGELRILIGASLDPEATLRHEAIHAMRALDLFTEAEWRALQKVATEGARLKDGTRTKPWLEAYEVEARYPDLAREEQVEEAIAEAFADFGRRGQPPPGSIVVTALNKVRRLLKALKSWLTGAGATRVEDVFEDVLAGEVGSRPRGEGREGAKDQRPAVQEEQDEAVSEVLDAELTDTVAPGMPAAARQDSFLRVLATQPLDAAFRIPFMAVGGLDRTGRWSYGKVGYAALSRAVTEAPMGFLTPVVERVRAGLVDRHGLDEDYVAREKRRTLDEALLMAEGKEHLDALKAANIGPEESKVLHAVLTGEAVAEGDMAKLAAPIREAIDQLGAEAVALGMLSPEAFERNRGTYLHRVYAKHELDQGAVGKWVAGFAAGRRQKIIGDQFKGRGMFMAVSPGRVMALTPGMVLARRRSARLSALEKRRADLERRREVARARLEERGGEMEATLGRRMGTGEASKRLAKRGGATVVRKPTPYQKGQAREQGVALGRLRGKGEQAWALYERIDGQLASVEARIAEVEDALGAQAEVTPEQGARVRILEKRTPLAKPTKRGAHGVHRVYVPEGQAAPEGLEGYQDLGDWEVRGTKQGKVVLWRDFTKPERVKMGEILDARYTVAKTYSLMAHDLATGRFFRDIAANPEWSVEEPPEGAVTDQDPEFRRLGKRVWSDPRLEWVKVPDTTIGKSGTKRYGALAGRYVRAEIWRDLEELRALNTPSFWRALLTQFKLNKTARNPGTHVNNVMSNVMLMDMADVRVPDLVAGLRSLVKGDDAWTEAMGAGAFGADILSQEVRDTVLKPLLEELKGLDVEGRGEAETLATSYLGKIGTVGVALDKIAAGLKRLDGAAMAAYQLEDQVFRMALFHRRRAQGLSVEEAAQEARDQFLDYDIRAPWVNIARQTALPFIAYTYRAVPRLAQMMLERPWKLAKYFAVMQALNMMAYAVAPSGDDEEDERRSMPDNAQGVSWTGVPRMVRMPWLSDDLPVFLDVRRWLPAGDVFDTSGGDLPAWLQVGGPIQIAAELYMNRVAFTGEDIVNPVTDTLGERMGARAGHLWSSFMPSWVPGGANAEKVARAWSGEALPYASTRPYNLGEAIASALGVKVAPQEVDRGFELHALEFDRIERELRSQLSSLRRQLRRSLIDQAEFDQEAATIRTKLERLNERRAEVLP